MSYLRQESPTRNFDMLQDQYNQEAQRNWGEGKVKQNLYHRIAQLEQANIEERKRMQRQLKNKQDQKIQDFWKADRDRYAEEQRRRKQQIDQVRRKNQSMSVEIMNSSKLKQDFIPHSDFNEYYIEQMHKQKRQQEEFIRNAAELQQIKKQKQMHEKNIQKEIDFKKEQQRKQLQYKRESELRRVRQKHQQNFSAYHNLEEHIKSKEKEEQILEQYIINKGGNDQQAKLIAKRLEFEVMEKERKEKYIKDLKNQFDTHQYSNMIGRKIEIQHQRDMIEQRNRHFSQMDRMNKMRKSQENQHMLEVLKHQVKPRKLIPDPQVIEAVGSGSPVNIGKVMGDDRKRQLSWIEKSLLRQIHY